MGRNIVGIESASYYYFGKPLNEITWAGAALLVTLPNDPSRVNLSRSREQLLRKRDRLLKRLLANDLIDKTTCKLALAEPLPDDQKRIPFLAAHFSDLALAKTERSQVVQTTLDLEIQAHAERICRRHHRVLADGGIHNLAVIIAETATGKIRGYIGSQDFLDSLHQGQVDGVRSHRSTGSLLKPFLVAKLLDRGPYTMQSKIHDVPTFFSTFAPQNASKTFNGLVSLEEVLIKSLNVPAVRLLNSYGVRDFYHFLSDAGLQGLFRAPEEYGLTLILGGAEASLWELTALYLAMGNYGEALPLRIHEAQEKRAKTKKRTDENVFSKGAAWLTLQALNKLSRPGIEHYWHLFTNQIPVAWKTGTSYGQKDGWAIGVNGEWTIGVWTGNFNGLGNAALTGSRSAAPVLFDLFNMLPSDPEKVWFEEPEYDLTETTCCSRSGYPAGPYCSETVLLKRPVRSYMPGTCPFHRQYIVDRHTGKSVCSLCWSVADTIRVCRYIVPAAVREILDHQGYAVDNIPQHASRCPSFGDDNRLDIAYPVDHIRILVPRDLDGLYEQVVFSAKHQRPQTELFWYLNGRLLGNTVDYHTLSVDLHPGDYTLTVMDEEGFSRSVSFEAYRN
jgi:penicillin-binding protein 1C